MGAQTYLVREFAKEPEKTNRYIINFSVLGLVVGVVTLVIFWSILPLLNYSYELMISMYIIVLAILPGTMNVVQSSAFVAHQKTQYNTYTTSISAFLNVIISIYLLSQGYGVISLVITLVVLRYMVMFILFYFINRHIVVLSWNFEFPFVIEIMKGIKTFAAISVLGALYVEPEIIILSLFVAEDQVVITVWLLRSLACGYFVPQVFMTNVYPVLSRSFYTGSENFNGFWINRLNIYWPCLSRGSRFDDSR